ncbi:MAG: class I SAM-dependent methyltransferase [Deltaproteobacteria bacterium]|nr:class I SAM-dependent methyltransferase [Deltaproteobacteria bacterium]
MIKKGEISNSKDIGFDELYQGTPPWEIGRPQKEIIKLEKNGLIQNDVLDIGCGTGENALFLSKCGYKVWGIDSAPLAIQKAQEKAHTQELDVKFQVHDALHLEDLNKMFSTIIDCGLFHVFDDESRKQYVQSLAKILRPKGHYLMLCFSEREPGTWGPRRITKDEIQQSFHNGWKIEEIKAAKFETNFDEALVEAWLANIIKL